MAKFLKSIFHPTEKRKSVHRDGETEEEKSEDQQLSIRRKLSISRSGRLKQSNKKRHSLTLDLYGEDGQTVEKPKSMEYHVHNPAKQLPTTPKFDKNHRRRSTDEVTSTIELDKAAEKSRGVKKISVDKIQSDGAKSPEEEIDNAFEIIDKS